MRLQTEGIVVFFFFNQP